MIFTPTAIPGVFVVDIERKADERGWFGRTYCEEELARHGPPWRATQCNIAFNERAGTLRGLHYQAEPVPDPKLVRCSRGRMFDVAVDLRPGSPTYRRWVGEVLDSERRNALLVPAGCAQGYLTLEDSTEVFYTMGAPYAPDLARGVRWDDVAFGIDWPSAPVVISERDVAYPDFRP